MTAAKGDTDFAVQLSQLYLKLGDFHRSADALRPLLSKFASSDADTQQIMISAFLLAGDAEMAGELLLKRSAIPASDRLSLLGLKDLVAGESAKAALDLQRAFSSNPQDAWTGYLLGKAWYSTGDKSRAMSVWGGVVKLPSAPPQAFIQLSILKARAGSLNEADALLDRVKGDDRKLPSYWQAAALIARMRKHAAMELTENGYGAYNSGDPWQAETIWRSALKGAADDLAREIYSALSNSAMRRADAEAALRYAGAAAKRWPNDAEILRQHAETLLAQSQLTAALDAAQRFQAMAPANRQARAAELLSRIALDAGKPDILQSSALRNRTLAPTDPMPLLHQAEWQGQQGRDTANLEKTLGLYAEARSIAPANAEASARAGVILSDLKRSPEAISMLLRALTLNPRVMDGTPSALLLQLYQRSANTYEGQFEAKWYQWVRTLKETWPTLLKTMRQPEAPAADWQALGEMALRRHESWIALCAFTRRVRTSPTDPVAWQELAMAQKRLGWFDEALESMIHARSLHKE